MCLKKDGDGGLAPGKLVFADALEAFTGKSYPELKRALTGGRAPHAENLGGPAIVGAINASQILSDLPVTFKFYGATGNDGTADFLRSIIAKTPLDASNYVTLPGASPSTDVLSDPRAHEGKESALSSIRSEHVMPIRRNSCRLLFMRRISSGSARRLWYPRSMRSFPYC